MTGGPDGAESTVPAASSVTSYSLMLLHSGMAKGDVQIGTTQ